MNKIKKYLTIAGFSLLPFLSYSQKPNTAKGNILINPFFDGPKEFARIIISNSENKIIDTLQTSVSGMSYYNLPAKDSTTYLARIEPGKDFLGEKGEIFKPYNSSFKVTPGENPLKILKRNKLEKQLANRFKE